MRRVAHREDGSDSDADQGVESVRLHLSFGVASEQHEWQGLLSSTLAIQAAWQSAYSQGSGKVKWIFKRSLQCGDVKAGPSHAQMV